MKTCKDCGAEVSESAKTCPRCGAKLKGKAGKIVLIVVVVIVVLGVIGGLAGGGNSSSSNSSSTTTSSTSTSSSSSAQTTTTDAHANDTAYSLSNKKFETVEEAVMTESYGMPQVNGTLKNISGKSFTYAQVEINFYDGDGAQIGSSLDNINNLEADGIWKYEVIGLSCEGASSFKIAGISCW